MKQLAATETLSIFIRKFKKEFKGTPTKKEIWSYYEGMIVAYDVMVKLRNKKY